MFCSVSMSCACHCRRAHRRQGGFLGSTVRIGFVDAMAGFGAGKAGRESGMRQGRGAGRASSREALGAQVGRTQCVLHGVTRSAAFSGRRLRWKISDIRIAAFGLRPSAAPAPHVAAVGLCRASPGGPSLLLGGLLAGGAPRSGGAPCARDAARAPARHQGVGREAWVGNPLRHHPRKIVSEDRSSKPSLLDAPALTMLAPWCLELARVAFRESPVVLRALSARALLT